MKTNQSLAPNNGGAMQNTTFSQALASPSYQKLLTTAVGSGQGIKDFCAQLITAYNTVPRLNQCTYDSIVAAALPFASYKFPIGMGYAWIIPYGNKAQFQMGAAGYLQLAMRSGQYKSIRTMDIREGEFTGRDPSTGEETFDFIKDDTVREDLPIIGYLASFELLNGFKSSVYFPKAKLLKWAQRYSKAFNINLFKKYEVYQETGTGLTPDELRACSSPWYEHFDSMCRKTVLRQLLKTGVLSVELVNAFRAEDEGGTNVIDASQVIVPVEEKKPEPVVVEADTGEVIEEAPAQPKRGRKPKAEAPVQDYSDVTAEDMDNLFFTGEDK